MQMAAANIKDWEESSPKQGQPPECHPIEDKRRGSGRKKQRLRERNSISKRDLSYPRWEVPPLTGRFLLSSSTLCISSPKIKPWMSCTCLPIHFYWLFSCTIHSISSILKMFWLWLITCTVLLTSYLLLRGCFWETVLSPLALRKTQTTGPFLRVVLQCAALRDETVSPQQRANLLASCSKTQVPQALYCSPVM